MLFPELGMPFPLHLHESALDLHHWLYLVGDALDPFLCLTSIC